MNNTEVALWAQNQEPSALLELFIDSFNKSNEQYNALLDDLKRTESKLEAEKRLTEKLNEKVAKQAEIINTLEEENKRANAALKTALKNGETLQKIHASHTALEAQHQTLQRRWNEANPDALKKQNKRLKEKNEEYKTKNNVTNQTLKTTQHKLKLAINENNELQIDKATLEKQLKISKGVGIWSKDSETLSIWPKTTHSKDSNGELYECTSLLYMHNSGRAALITYNNTDGLEVCKAPSGGLRPSKELLAYSENWLYKVNREQKGSVLDEDMIPVNHNSKLDAA